MILSFIGKQRGEGTLTTTRSSVEYEQVSKWAVKMRDDTYSI